ncbi:MAG: cation:proton antiporter [Candidatus Brocadiae bacterium]|nr:cation:proton antiporter [Candidatus Brocadiia bacterium]
MSAGAEGARLLIVALLAGLLGQALSALTRLPSIIFLLGLGVLLGADGLGLIIPSDLGAGLEVLVRIGVAFILFEGGMTLRLRYLVQVQRSIRLLISLGVGITFVLATAAAIWVGGLSPPHAALFGALVTVTGPTVIKPILRRVRLRPEVAAIMEGEGILADPVGAILAAVCLEYVLSPSGSVGHHLASFAARLAVGAVAGGALGYMAGLAVKGRTPAIERIIPLFTLGCALGAYQIAENFREDAGIMAAVCAGLAIQHGIRRDHRELREFKELITVLVLSVLFVLLAANLSRQRMLAEGWPGFLTVLLIIFVIRPINVFACTWGDRLRFREKIFLSWVAPRGIVAASVASLAALLLQASGDPEAHRAESLVFLTIFSTVLAQGLSAWPVAALLGIQRAHSRSVIIVGANRIARRVGEAFRDAGKRVTFIDRNPELIEAALAAGMRGVVGDASDREALAQARLQDADVFVALTARSAVNQAAAMIAVHDHEVDEVHIALDDSDRKGLDEALERLHAQLTFGRPVPITAWLQRIASREAGFSEFDVGERGVSRKPLREAPFPSDVLPLMVRSGESLTLASGDTMLKVGDKVLVICRPADRDGIAAWLGSKSPRFDAETSAGRAQA